MLLPFWTDGCIGSMEGLYFESSATVPYHFMTAAELSKAPSNPQRDLPYTSLDMAKGVQHLQMLGARYYLAFSPEAVAQADANPDLTLVRPDRRLAGLRGQGLGARLPPDQPAGGDHRRGQGRAGLDGGHVRLVPGLRRPRRLPGRVRAQGVAAGQGQQGRHRLQDDRLRRRGGRPPSGGPSTRWSVSGITNSDNRISFDVDRVGVPVLVKASYFPSWKVKGGHGPYRVSPNLMVVIPTSKHVSVYYGWTPVDYTGWLLTFIGIGLAVKWARRGPMVVDDPDRPVPLLPSPADADGGPARPSGPGGRDRGPRPTRPTRPTRTRSTPRPRPGGAAAGPGLRPRRLRPSARPTPLTVEDLRVHPPGPDSDRSGRPDPSGRRPPPPATGRGRRHRPRPRPRRGGPLPHRVPPVARRGPHRQHRPPARSATCSGPSATTGRRRSSTCSSTAGWTWPAPATWPPGPCSGLLSVASLPLMGLAGRRLVRTAPRRCRRPWPTRWVAWAGVLLLASSPFAIHYATEARMYSLVVLLVLAGFLALDTVRHRPSWRASVGLGLVTGLLLLTHYWAFFLVAAVAGLLAVRAARSRGARRALLAMAVGSLLFVPWLPSFLEQMRTTGTPWGTPPKPRAVFDIVLQFGAGLVRHRRCRWACSSTPSSSWACSGAAAGRRRPDRHPRPPGPAAGADAGRRRRSHHGPGRGRRPDHRVRLRHPLRGGRVPPGAAAGRPGLRHPRRHLAGSGGVGPGRRPRLRHRHPQRRRRPHDRGTGGRRPPGRGPPGRRGRLLPRPARTVGEPPAGGRRAGLRQLTFPRATRPQLVDWVDYLAANQAAPGALRPHAASTWPVPTPPSGWCGRPTTAPSAPGARACSPTSAPSGPTSGGWSRCRRTPSSARVWSGTRPD